MDNKQLTSILRRAGCSYDKKNTRLGSYATATKDNFTADQYYNRLNAGWKTAQYIIVDDCPQSFLEKLLIRWKTLAEDFHNQYLFVFDSANNNYCVYNSAGKFLGDDSIIYDLLDLTDKEKRMEKNLIIFGAPGTGKSFKLDEEKKVLLKDGGYCERVTFHPDYSYANFVGTYKPVPKGEDKISYEYVPGPFMRVWMSARENSLKNHLLLIEEINRANPAAVFGDVFQLLDRKDGASEYPIQTSEELRDYLVRKLGGVQEDYKELSIPNNMYIWATMNSADQGVFPMDTAFKRRWDFEYIGIDDGEEEPGVKEILNNANFEVANQKLNWNKLRKAINDKLSSSGVNEDKLMGPFFINIDFLKKYEDENFGEEFVKVFKNKVIMYLFEDAAKQKRSSLFNVDTKNLNRYSKICDEFDARGIEIFNGAAEYIAANFEQ